MNLTKTSTFTITMGEEYARKLARAVSETLAKLDATSPGYVELVNKGHIDTLCWVKNALQMELGKEWG